MVVFSRILLISFLAFALFPASLRASTYVFTYDEAGRLMRIEGDFASVACAYAPTGVTVSVENYVSDADGDGLSDWWETTHGTNPTSNDSDGDGMPDGWEVRYGLNPLVDDASGDIDGDGFSNLKEYRGGSSPVDPNETPYWKGFMPAMRLLLLR